MTEHFKKFYCLFDILFCEVDVLLPFFKIMNYLVYIDLLESFIYSRMYLLMVICIANIFAHSVACFFTFLIVSLDDWKIFISTQFIL